MRHLVGERDRSQLRRLALEQLDHPALILGGLAPGVTKDGRGADDQQPAQVMVAGFADPAARGLAAG